MLKVLITVDTEFWPDDADWPHTPLARPLPSQERAYARDVLGRTVNGDYGLEYMLRSLEAHDLRAVFFVEALSASALGDTLLQRCVRSIVTAGQEVQLHVHTEWLSEAKAPGLPQEHRPNLGDFSLDEQAAIVRAGAANLRAAGAPDVMALRAGNLGGNRDTPRAARLSGLELDLSFDPAQGPAIRTLLEEARDSVDDACPTVPLSWVEDYPGHFRHAQLTALSFAELRHALLEAVRKDWPCFVILSHGFELMLGGRMRGPARPNPINIARWNRLCAFLDEHRDVMHTAGCRDLLADPGCASLLAPIRTRPLDSMLRLAEQLQSRLRELAPQPVPQNPRTPPRIAHTTLARQRGNTTSSPD